MNQSKGLDRFLAENGDRPTTELLKYRPSDDAVERLGRGWAAENPKEKEKTK